MRSTHSHISLHFILMYQSSHIDEPSLFQIWAQFLSGQVDIRSHEVALLGVAKCAIAPGHLEAVDYWSYFNKPSPENVFKRAAPFTFGPAGGKCWHTWSSHQQMEGLLRLFYLVTCVTHELGCQRSICWTFGLRLHSVCASLSCQHKQESSLAVASTADGRAIALSHHKNRGSLAANALLT